MKPGGALPADRPAALLLAPESPYPLAGGGALRTASLLHYLAARYDTDLFVFRQPGAPDPAKTLPPGLARRIVVLDLPPNGRGVAARVVRNAGRVARRIPPLVDRFAGFDRAIAQAVAGRRYAVGIVEHFWCAPYADALAPACDRLVLDLHNVESLLHERCAATETGGAAFAHRVFSRASRNLERRWLPRFDRILVASADDAARLPSTTRPIVYPNAIPAPPEPVRGDDEAVVFSGNLEYHPNQTAVRFFRKEIWPALRETSPTLIWRLVGRNPEAVAEFTAGDPRIEVVGPVEDAVAALARCRVAVVARRAGTGTRLKILEAWAAGLPVVSTTIGAEGLGARDGEHLLIANGAPAFARAVARLLACNDLRIAIATAGRSLLHKEFTWETAWRKLEF
jgi:glycosyltransferase involved in cell wall biosynthesis